MVAPWRVDETFRRRQLEQDAQGPQGEATGAAMRTVKTGKYSSARLPVIGMLDRELRQVRAKVFPNVKRETLQNAILDQREHRSPRSTPMRQLGYDNLEQEIRP